jgi:hypothetical protein
MFLVLSAESQSTGCFYECYDATRYLNLQQKQRQKERDKEGYAEFGVLHCRWEWINQSTHIGDPVLPLLRQDVAAWHFFLSRVWSHWERDPANAACIPLPLALMRTRTLLSFLFSFFLSFFFLPEITFLLFLLSSYYIHTELKKTLLKMYRNGVTNDK